MLRRTIMCLTGEDHAIGFSLFNRFNSYGGSPAVATMRATFRNIREIMFRPLSLIHEVCHIASVNCVDCPTEAEE